MNWIRDNYFNETLIHKTTRGLQIESHIKIIRSDKLQNLHSDIFSPQVRCLTKMCVADGTTLTFTAQCHIVPNAVFMCVR